MRTKSVLIVLSAAVWACAAATCCSCAVCAGRSARLVVAAGIDSLAERISSDVFCAAFAMVAGMERGADGK